MLGNLLDGKGRQKSRGGTRPDTWKQYARQRLFSLPTALAFVWFFVLHWGERSSFSSDVNSCDWAAWEQWPIQAQPHRVVFIADPQLVDPHTYPGRPWPLSSLTIAFTDKYLKRSYRLIQNVLDPDTLFFLGDLFDGGREWATDQEGFEETEKRWKGYGEQYWLKEYNRFGKIFFEPDQFHGGRPSGKEKKLIASLPGNHDLGFGTGIQKPVRDRFRAYFGESDRVDVIGNHTFVSLDTVSLSAMGQPDSSDELWNSTLLFLDQAQDIKRRAVQQELKMQHEIQPHKKYEHTVTLAEDLERHQTQDKIKESKSELPTIVLTHVPLYRDPGTPCGPMREKYPPSAPNLEHDEQNAIRVAAGYQYQNVLTRDISKTIAEKVGNVGYVFSGDDHDYCEVVHRGYPSAGAGIREITVKSMSWAMGVRKPGFLLMSLWNPIDAQGQSLYDIAGGQHPGDATVQTHLCLLPDQLGIFIRYGLLAFFSIGLVAVYSVMQASKSGANASPGSSSPVLPTTEPTKRRDSNEGTRSRAESGSAHSTNSSEASSALYSRSVNARTRSVSPAVVGGYGLPSVQSRPNASLIEQAGYYGKERDLDPTDEWGNPRVRSKPKIRKPKGFGGRLVEHLGRNMGWVAGPVLFYYYWLLKHG
ncbi:hypothetical protein MBLNU459_g4356t1 [Dothideomycetes sp. NU459]